MKNIYEAPFAEFEEIETEDVILTSGGSIEQKEKESMTEAADDKGNNVNDNDDF